MVATTPDNAAMAKIWISFDPKRWKPTYREGPPIDVRRRMAAQWLEVPIITTPPPPPRSSESLREIALSRLALLETLKEHHRALQAAGAHAGSDFAQWLEESARALPEVAGELGVLLKNPPGTKAYGAFVTKQMGRAEHLLTTMTRSAWSPWRLIDRFT